jgi:hypothetical protein
MTVYAFIKQLGGATQVARELGVPMTTVATWGQRNSIPQWRIGAVAELAVRRGVQVPVRFAELAA